MSARQTMADMRQQATICEQQGETMLANVFAHAAESIDTALPDAFTRDAIATLMDTHGHTLTVEQRAAVRGWLGRAA